MQPAHAHSQAGSSSRQTISRIAVSLGLTLAFVVVEAGAGLWANSLALLSDAGHNLTDVVALALSWYAIRLAAQSANANKTFGYHRAGILVALINSTTLVLIALGIFYESYRRFVAPPHVQANVLIGVGLVAFLVNLGTALLVRRGSEHDLNLRSAYVHLMGDVLSTVGAIIAGIVIALTGMNWLDPLVSVLIAVLILWNAWGILKETVNILLESTPNDIDTAKLVSSLIGVKGVNGVHDLHIWSITQGIRALSAHILADDMSISDGARIQREITEILYHQFNIGHGTLQLECSGCESVVLYCDIAASDTRDNHRHTSPATEGRA
jgi:cobalt-zinc-cadmium efflux system protein